jgi:O-6-methylguanine DNA methyltransferase
VETVYCAAFPFAVGEMWLAATAAGLCRVALPQRGRDGLFRWLAKHIPEGEIIMSAGANLRYAAAIAAYLAGDVREFTVPLDLRGTAFQRLVWMEVGRIPYGRTATYREIAARIGRPAAYRAVGAANGANPVPPFIPCHRVVGSDGTLTGYGGGLALKRQLLELEGSFRPAAGEFQQ